MIKLTVMGVNFKCHYSIYTVSLPSVLQKHKTKNLNPWNLTFHLNERTPTAVFANNLLWRTFGSKWEGVQTERIYLWTFIMNTCHEILLVWSNQQGASEENMHNTWERRNVCIKLLSETWKWSTGGQG